MDTIDFSLPEIPAFDEAEVAAAADALTQLDHLDDWSYQEWEDMDDWQRKSAMDAAQSVLGAANAVPRAMLALVWTQAYRQGVQDERMSEANIGIEGPGVKTQPNRANPYT